MKKIIITIALATVAGGVFAQENGAQKRDLGRLSGSFETNTIYYTDDTKTGAIAPTHPYGSNNYLKLDYGWKKLSAGVQLEYYPQPLQGIPMEGLEDELKGFGLNNLTGKYIAWTDDRFSVTVGDFYEQFGSGLIFRSWEDRALGMNNSIGGARVTFNIGNFLQGKALYGFPRFNLGYLDTQIGGGDLSLSLSNLFGMDEHVLNLEGSAINRRFKGQPEWYADGLEWGLFDFKLPRNVTSYSARAAWEYRGWMAKFEYDIKSKDVDNLELKRGNAQLFEAGYTGDGFAVVGQFRRLHLMNAKLYRSNTGDRLETLPNNTFNYIPALSPQHAYMLASLDPNVAETTIGEIGGQIDAFYNFKRGTALGGKRGMKIHANYSRSNKLDLDGSVGGFLYRDFSFDIDKSWNSKLRTLLFMSFQKNSLHDSAQNIFTADVTYKFTRSFSLRGELHYNHVSRDAGMTEKGDWWGALLEANLAPSWSIFASDMCNHGDTKIHYYQAGVSYTHSIVRVQASWGRNRKGLICSGGVCREMPAYTGLNIAATVTF